MSQDSPSYEAMRATAMAHSLSVTELCQQRAALTDKITHLVKVLRDTREMVQFWEHEQSVSILPSEDDLASTLANIDAALKAAS